ncbi:hypothetical protein EVAR_83810_1 [Eumeta japonica]|uniref:Uncharacterized protein n=1 Tax=Eumeta variegata TaxID=151549 RepID=A0A4C1WFE6_EUMVA|nr:hypothetical protein EVAR_83810_1 [Eumeta japonica]
MDPLLDILLYDKNVHARRRAGRVSRCLFRKRRRTDTRECSERPHPPPGAQPPRARDPGTTRNRFKMPLLLFPPATSAFTCPYRPARLPRAGRPVRLPAPDGRAGRAPAAAALQSASVARILVVAV